MDKLETYLSDHLSGSIVAIDLARRRASSQGDDEIGTDLRRFAAVAARLGIGAAKAGTGSSIGGS